MITTVTLNPAIDREFFVERDNINLNQYIYHEQNIKVTPGGRGLLSAINLKKLGYADVQNIGFVGGKQGLFFEKMVQEYGVTTNYVYTENEMRNNIFVIGKNPVTYTHYNDYTYRVEPNDIEVLLERFKRGIVDSDLVMIAGSVPEGINFDIYQKLIQICHQEGKEVYLHASGEELNRALKEEPQVVAPYFRHINKILDIRTVRFEDYYRVGRKLQEAGAVHAIVPYHNKQLLFDKRKVYILSAKNFRQRNLLGASDAYHAAFFNYIFRNGFDFVEANRHAGAAALAVAERKEIFLEDRAQVEENLARITIEEVEVDIDEFS
ncbi:PfkB family carbohydrate kinase [Natroniella sulfidigena]|uniref:1-phosphofructokinase family hexose kinase n=1 Tax=Natroniella sulfidigena TaxID=723921 RepID=UPI00200A8841|nr:PfkB family carbohydrate kinase [Natroniella sulfidigena]MCK8817984.1 PfkB family carbohydrate kinase [Natroniella sulfidigena]